MLGSVVGQKHSVHGLTREARGLRPFLSRPDKGHGDATCNLERQPVPLPSLGVPAVRGRM